MKRLLSVFILFLASFNLLAQIDVANPDLNLNADYVAPTEPAVQAKLEQWKNLKFGMIIHWGLYAVPGIVESWSICAEDVDWIPRDSNMKYEDYKQWYWELASRFNPQKFDPDQWAQTAKDAGMKYLIFTTKHHDGFAMFNTKYSNFSIADGPFRNHPMADVARYVFESFRNKGMMVGAYFSKPDWHSQDYWWDRYATPDRHVNYDISKHPYKWQNFSNFVYNQIEELMSDYGNIDILWLDGGWVRAPKEDINMDNIARMARQHQPGMIMVDRTVQGLYENYRTPEKLIPEKQLPYPWETCIPLSKDWGYVPTNTYKSANQIINTLMEVVAKGGSLLLGVGPTPEGLIDDHAVAVLKQIGAWMDANGESIYNTLPLAIYNSGNVWFTTSKDGNTIYALCPASIERPIGKQISWTGNLPAKGSKIRDLASGKVLKHTVKGNVVTVTLPADICTSPMALSFAVGTSSEKEKINDSYIDLNKNGRLDPYENPNLSIEERVDDLLSLMTLDEKAGQLLMAMSWNYYDRNGDDCHTTPEFEQAMKGMPLGSTYALMRADPWIKKTLATGLNPKLSLQLTNNMQLWIRQNTRLGIPLLIAEECPHGHMAIGTTVLPTAMGRASTFNRDLEFQLGKMTAVQAWAQGASMALGPTVDIALDPRWSRMEEGYGEDPVLAAIMGGSYAKGIESDGRMIAVMKHLAAYGATEGGHHGGTTHVGHRELLGNLCLPFKQKHLGGVMTAYNDIDGIPCTAHEWLIKQILRKTWHFDGLVVSDLFAVDGLMNTRVAADKTEAAAIALKSGVDIDLAASCYRFLPEALAQGLVTEEDINTSVRYVLLWKFKLGLFDQDYKDKARSIDFKSAEKLNLQAARESVVLLKNECQTLPFSKEVKRIAVIGPNADNVYNMLGDYTAPQADGDVITLLQGIRNKMPDCQIDYVKGCAIRDTSDTDIDAAVTAAQETDIVIVAVGGSSARDFRSNYNNKGMDDSESAKLRDMDSGEGYDRSSLSLLGKQEALLQALVQTKKPMAVILIQGRPLDVSGAVFDSIPAILCAWYPGSQGGNALADILFGDYNPSGRLPVSYPRSAGQLPVYYNTVSPRRDYTDGTVQPLYPFGYGLSYTTFVYDSLSINQSLAQEDSIVVSFTLQNTGNCAGAEVVQLYLRNEHAAVALPERQLIDFQKIFLQKNEEKTVTFTLKREDLGWIDCEGRLRTEDKDFTLMLGASSQDIRLEGKLVLP